jgi:hypothetical protein
MPEPLDYRPVEPRIRSLALPALICGICSGPVASALALLASANHLPEKTKEGLALISFAGILGGAFIFACAARLLLPDGAPARLRRLTGIAIAAPILWCIPIIAYLYYALRQMGAP